MRKAIGRATMVVSIGLAAYLGIYVEDYVNASDWIDQTEKKFRKLSKDEGAVDIEVVFHHTATSDKISASELCDITNSRFNLGCSYAISVHPNGKVIQLNDFAEHTPSVGGRNSRVISIAFVGDYQKNEIPHIMIERALQIKKAFDAYDKDNDDFKIKGYYLHRDFRNTLCPGDKAVKELKKHHIVR